MSGREKQMRVVVGRAECSQALISAVPEAPGREARVSGGRHRPRPGGQGGVV
ncbi:hypothetical protein [Streptomyces neyagawaensis]|uniref:hypothetical protein n=1 Tax=Streptomyces neyagawaensis TaxID=42238 RepID=UPI000AFD144C|nr:hypothetical protein [Streptomyces neyagawaensis]MCL6738513.1 hypothetical protein [Streptomyces neyagawaensis]MDE1688660.1 hypothetical protein [Streptomyces neyagawaensis]